MNERATKRAGRTVRQLSPDELVEIEEAIEQVVRYVRQRFRTADPDDMRQVGWQAVLESAHRFDGQRGALRPYAARAAYRQVVMAVVRGYAPVTLSKAQLPRACEYANGADPWWCEQREIWLHANAQVPEEAHAARTAVLRAWVRGLPHKWQRSAAAKAMALVAKGKPVRPRVMRRMQAWLVRYPEVRALTDGLAERLPGDEGSP